MDKLKDALEGADNTSKVLILAGVIALVALIGYLIGYLI